MHRRSAEAAGCAHVSWMFVHLRCCASLQPVTAFPAVSVRTPVGKIQDVNSHQSTRLSFFLNDMFSALIFIFPLWRSGSQELVPLGLVRFFTVSEQGQNTPRKLRRQPLLPAFTLQSANVFCFHQFNIVTLEFLAILWSKAHKLYC